ncbi:radical SAM protein [Candidatus Woesearchaeota archaeon]|nr:radical SAM protein [Candidatus Woesearchaeota archaeon]
MKILVIDASFITLNNKFKYGDIVPQLQIGYIISILEENNYENYFLDCKLINDMDNSLEDYSNIAPNIVIISFNTYDYKFAFKLANFFKDNNIIIAIGPHPSVSPSTVVYENSPFDFVLRGECEYDIINLIKNLDNMEELKKIKSLYFNDKKDSEISLINQFDELPYPKYHSYDGQYYQILPVPFFKKAKWGFLSSSRGCPNLCTFCSPVHRTSYGYKYRIRSSRGVVDEMEYLVSIGKNVIEIVDDNFTVSKKQVFEICDEIKKRNLKIKWTVQAKADTLNRDIIFKMKDAGCFCIRMGIETGSNKLINNIKKYNGDWKNLVIDVFKWGKEANIIMNSYVILGLPNETKEDREETVNLLKEAKPDFVQVHYFKPYPGSSLYENISNKEDFNEYLYHYNCSSEEFEEIKNKIHKIVYFNPRSITKHLSLFSGFYIKNPKILLRLINFLFN